MGIPGNPRYVHMNVATNANPNERMTKFLCGGIAGAISRTAVAPFERLKILMQTNSFVPTYPTQRITLLHGFQSIWRTEGWRGLMRGNALNVLRIAPTTAVQFLVNDEIKELFVYLKGKDVNVDSLSFLERLAAGSLAGGMHVCVWCGDELSYEIKELFKRRRRESPLLYESHSSTL
jgi:hypothetical protein